jgi:hypothetical protein
MEVTILKARVMKATFNEEYEVANFTLSEPKQGKNTEGWNKIKVAFWGKYGSYLMDRIIPYEQDVAPGTLVSVTVTDANINLYEYNEEMFADIEGRGVKLALLADYAESQSEGEAPAKDKATNTKAKTSTTRRSGGTRSAAVEAF